MFIAFVAEVAGEAMVYGLSRYLDTVVQNAISATGKTEVWTNLYGTYASLRFEPYFDESNAVTNDELFDVINPTTRECVDELFSCLIRNPSQMSDDGFESSVMNGDIDPMRIESLSLRFEPYFNESNAVTNDELFDVINPTTRECVDELFSCLIRNPSQMSDDGFESSVMNGDIEPMWIESLNTATDDNKVLTLPGNERIVQTQTMCLPFDLSWSTTPATVFHSGILTPDVTHKQMLCTLLDCLLTRMACPPETARDVHETYFVFTCLWVFSSATFQDQLIDWRVEFSKWWLTEIKMNKISSSRSVYKYSIDTEPKQFLPWSDLVIPLQGVLDSSIKITEEPEPTKIMDLNNLNPNTPKVCLKKREFKQTYVPKPVKKLPRSMDTYHPVQLLNELMPDLQYDVTVISNPPADIRVESKINGVLMVGRASKKKAAQRQIAVEALDMFYGIRLPNSHDQTTHVIGGTRSH